MQIQENKEHSFSVTIHQISSQLVIVYMAKDQCKINRLGYPGKTLNLLGLMSFESTNLLSKLRGKR